MAVRYASCIDHPGRRSMSSGQDARTGGRRERGPLPHRPTGWRLDVGHRTAGSWNRATPARAARRSIRSRPARASASGTWSHRSTLVHTARPPRGRRTRGRPRRPRARPPRVPAAGRAPRTSGMRARPRECARARPWTRAFARRPNAAAFVRPAAVVVDRLLEQRMPGTRSARPRPSGRGPAPGDPRSTRRRRRARARPWKQPPR